MRATLLVELLTEELPPKSLRELSEAFARELRAVLERHGFLESGSAVHSYATPRRLAARITLVRDRSPDSERDIVGPSVSAPAQAVAGFARKHGLAVADLQRAPSPKGEVHVARVKSSGVALDSVLAASVGEAIKALPIARVMRWGDGDAEFVRPVHGVVLLHGAREIPGTVLGVSASGTTRGHRFLGTGSIGFAHADEYESRLAENGCVIADFARRRAEIERLLLAEAAREQGVLGDYESLLDEVTALVEHPSVYAGGFDPAFLEVPHECLTLTMRQNQKYFPLFDPQARLLPRFLIVSNMRVADPRHIVGGNERVVRPRLEDARFFYDQDRRARLEERVPQLAKVIYHNRLGTQLQRVERIQLLAGFIARELGADAALAERAAWLSKADLVTGMVGEFPELQGVMGRYYALHDGEPPAVADAIEAHYRPRFAGDRLPEQPVACALALAEKLDTLIGMFAVGGAPTGDKDPFGLRRAAVGILRILLEASLALPLPRLLEHAEAGFRDTGVAASAAEQVRTFLTERLRNHLREAGHAADLVEAVLSPPPDRIDLVPARLEAIRAFGALPEAASLAAANKRIRNILRKSDAAAGEFDEALLRQPEEQKLFAALSAIEPQVASFMGRGQYRESLQAMARLQVPVDSFFDKVLVNAEDAALRANRHALLRRLDRLMNGAADLSKLAQ
jgi:glycyl-tRNA synthetase beta chain